MDVLTKVAALAPPNAVVLHGPVPVAPTWPVPGAVLYSKSIDTIDLSLRDIRASVAQSVKDSGNQKETLTAFADKLAAISDEVAKLKVADASLSRRVPDTKLVGSIGTWTNSAAASLSALRKADDRGLADIAREIKFAKLILK